MNTKDYTYGFKIGDLITAYHKGVHEIVEIRRRFYEHPNEIPSNLRESVHVGDEFNSLLVYKKVLNQDGTKARGIENCCDASYCHHFADFIAKKEEELMRFKSLLH